MANNGEYGQGQGALTKGATFVQEARGDLTRDSRKLSDNLQDLRKGWGGQGASAFFVLHQEWNEQQEKLLKALDEFENKLRGTEKDNMATDDNQSASMTHLKNKLGHH